MKIAISGANGYIAYNLSQRLDSPDIELIRISRKNLYDMDTLLGLLSGADVVVHMAGAPIFQKWTPANKAEIVRSRTETTQALVKAISNLPLEKRPSVFVSASAIGIYESGFEHSESSIRYASDFTGKVAQQWEQASEDLPRSVRRIIFRIGMVLGKESKTILNLLPLFKLGLGGKIGSGKQPFPFVHIDDVTNAIFWAIQNAEVHGIYNLVAPQNITNIQFTKAISKKLRRPAVFTVSAKVLELLYGEASSILLKSPAVVPERLQSYGFRFKFPDIESCLNEIMK
jgi:uncharacterized protein (TIGR01777 family)